MRIVFLIILLFNLSGCGPTWSTTNVKNDNPAESDSVKESAQNEIKKEIDPASILVTEEDISDRKYKILGDIEVTVRKTTIFHKDPTPEMAEEKLRAKGAELGADAIILVRHGEVGVSFWSWGALNSKGRAIAFIE